MHAEILEREQTLIQILKRHGEKAQHYFRKVRNERPPDSSHISIIYTEADLIEIRNRYDLDTDSERAGYLAYLDAIEAGYFEDCHEHVKACLARLCEQTKQAFRRYEGICERNAAYFQSGAHLAPAEISAQADQYDAVYRERKDTAFASVHGDPARWDDQFDPLYDTIEWFISTLAKMNILIEIEARSSHHQWTRRLGWIAVAVTVILFVLQQCASPPG